MEEKKLTDYEIVKALEQYNDKNEYFDKAVELQKRVDELETTNGQAMAYIDGLEYEVKELRKQVDELTLCFG